MIAWGVQVKLAINVRFEFCDSIGKGNPLLGGIGEQVDSWLLVGGMSFWRYVRGLNI